LLTVEALGRACSVKAINQFCDARQQEEGVLLVCRERFFHPDKRPIERVSRLIYHYFFSGSKIHFTFKIVSNIDRHTDSRQNTVLVYEMHCTKVHTRVSDIGEECGPTHK
jgi:hypothetical protein